MNKKIIPFVILLLGLSLLGIVGFQLYWINHALQVRRSQFDQDVTAALTKVAEKLETREAADVISDQMNTLDLTQAPKANVEEIAFLNLKEPAPYENSSKSASSKKYKGSALIKIDSLIVADRNKNSKPNRAPRSESKAPAGTWRVVTNADNALTQAYYARAGELRASSLDTTLHKLIKLNAAIDTFRIKDKVGHTFYRVLTDSTARVNFRLDTLNLSKIKSIEITKKNNAKPAKIDSNGVRIIQMNPMTELMTLPQGYQSSHNGTDLAASPRNYIFYQDRLQPARKVTVVEPAAKEIIRINENSQKQITPLIREQKVNAKAEKITDVIQKMAVEYVRKELPLERRVTKTQIDSLLTQELHDRGIFLPYDYALVTDKEKGKVHFQTVGFKPEFIPAAHQVRLFPNDIYTKSHFLSLHFYNEGAYVLHSMKYLMGASILFTCIILSTFLITIYTLLKQKKISDIKNDFINNMTHEFKTPLATISLAIDSINNPKVLDNKVRIQHYAAIIRDENKRMHTQVENVLQMALLDKEQLKLNKKQVNMHALICQAIQNMSLHIEAREGSITANLAAHQATLFGDEAHLGNIISNLLDNANKYSPARPEIFISTANTSAGLVVAIEDKGIGMSRETQKRIFDKFYRVSTGNIHTVKGFGLGLSYVKAIMLAHKGSVGVKSELGTGSRFELLFPGVKTV